MIVNDCGLALRLLITTSKNASRPNGNNSLPALNPGAMAAPGNQVDGSGRQPETC
jgi:hypothetical protein